MMKSCHVIFALLIVLVTCLTFSSGTCIWYEQCGKDPATRLPLNCAYNGSAKPLKKEESILILDEICPFLPRDSQNDMCCSDDQVIALRDTLGLLKAIVSRCPSCFLNLANVFCYLTCSANQSNFLQVTNTTLNIKGEKMVTALDYYVTDAYAQGMFNSCKDVQFAGSITAISLLCGSYGANCTAARLLNSLGTHPTSPLQMDFFLVNSSDIVVNSTTHYPMDSKVIPCFKAVSPKVQACSCADCRSSCTAPLPPA